MKCNLSCRGCYAGQYDTSEELSFDELDAILTEAKELGMFFFTFTGGEAFTGTQVGHKLGHVVYGHSTVVLYFCQFAGCGKHLV